MTKTVLTLALSILSVSAYAQDNDALRAACKADAQKLCANVQPGGGRILKCMRAQQGQLSDACKAALSARKSRSNS